MEIVVIILLLGVIVYLIYREYDTAKKSSSSIQLWAGLAALLLNKKSNKEKEEEELREELLRLFHYTSYRPFQEHNNFWKNLCNNLGTTIYVDDQNNVSSKVVDEVTQQIKKSMKAFPSLDNYLNNNSKINLEKLEEQTGYNEKQYKL